MTCIQGIPLSLFSGTRAFDGQSHRVDSWNQILLLQHLTIATRVQSSSVYPTPSTPTHPPHGCCLHFWSHLFSSNTISDSPVLSFHGLSVNMGDCIRFYLSNTKMARKEVLHAFEQNIYSASQWLCDLSVLSHGLVLQPLHPSSLKHRPDRAARLLRRPRVTWIALCIVCLQCDS